MHCKALWELKSNYGWNMNRGFTNVFSLFTSVLQISCPVLQLNVVYIQFHGFVICTNAGTGVLCGAPIFPWWIVSHSCAPTEANWYSVVSGAPAALSRCTVAIGFKVVCRAPAVTLRSPLPGVTSPGSNGPSDFQRGVGVLTVRDSLGKKGASSGQGCSIDLLLYVWAGSKAKKEISIWV